MGDWNKRMAVSVAETTLTPEAHEALLEAAGEIKCVELKVALGRAVEILNAALTSGDNSHFSQDDINEFRKLLGIVEYEA